MREAVTIYASEPANLLKIRSSFFRGFPFPKALVAAVKAAIGTLLGNFSLRKVTSPTEAVLFKDLLFPLGAGETEAFFIDSLLFSLQYNLIK